MRTIQFTRINVVDLRTEPGRALAGSGAWMIVGYVGAAALMLGLLAIFHGERNLPAALAYVAAGGALAAYAWRSAYRLLAGVETAAQGAGQARAAATRSASGLTTLVGAPEA